MSDSRKYLLGATATIVAARITARGKPGPGVAVKDEFVAVYRELEQAMAELGTQDEQKPYSKKRNSELDNLKDD